MGRRLALGDDERAAAETRLRRGFERALLYVQRRVVDAVGDAATTLVAAGSPVAEDDQIDVDTDDSEWGLLPLASPTATVNPASTYDPLWWSTAYQRNVRRPLRGFFDESRRQTADLLDVKLQDDEPHTAEAWEKLDDEARNRWGAPLHGFVTGKVEDAVTGGSTVAGLMGSLRDENGGWFNDDRAALLAVAAIATAWNRSTLSTATAARAAGTSSTKTWLTVGDDRVRPTHVEMDGVSIDVGEDFLVDGAYPAGGPHDDRLPPEETANCRCVLTYDADGGNVPDEVSSLVQEGEMLAEEGEVGLIDYESIQDSLPGGSSVSESAGDVEVDTHLADDVDEVTDLSAPAKRRRKLTVLDLGRFYSEDQPRAEDGRWGEGGSGGTKDGDTRVVSSEGGKTTVEFGTSSGSVTAVFLEGSGWSHTDKDVAGIAAAVADHAPPGTSLQFGGNAEVGTAAVDPSNPSTIMLGDRDIGDRNWAKAEQKDEFYRELDGSRWLIPEAFTGSRWDYTIAHESGHVAHLSGVDPDGKAKEVTAAIRATGEAGMSTYGNSHPFEAIAEGHAAWSLAGRPTSADGFRDRPAIRATVVAMGWAS